MGKKHSLKKDIAAGIAVCSTLDDKQQNRLLLWVWGGLAGMVGSVFLVLIIIGGLTAIFEPERAKKEPPFAELFKPLDGQPKDPKTDPVHTNSTYYKMSWQTEEARAKKYGVPKVP